MAGIYIHIPFCRQACYYCDFHFSTSLKNKIGFLDALRKEILLQKDYLGTKNINTVYFGGGTPSILSPEEILCLCDELSKYFFIDPKAEITLEANPDDLKEEKLNQLRQTPVNRLSIGIQSFSDVDLKFLNRIHNSEEAIECVRKAKDAGFENISIDLIYGIHTLTNKQWKKNLDLAFALDVQHVSCYSLTVEPKTALHSYIRKGRIKNISSKKSTEQFKILMKEMSKNYFIHYEISNFCKEGFHSKHNSNYWKGVNYLGLGPSAHSFDGNSRQWNVKSNSVYINYLNKNLLPIEREVLTEIQKYNEYILTSLRTIWGMDFNFVKNKFSQKLFSHMEKECDILIQKKMLSQKDEKIFLTHKGKLFADKITSDLFAVSG